MSREARLKVASITAAVTATAAAGYYAYDQYSKRYPKYQEQAAMFAEVIGVARQTVSALHSSGATDSDL